jgi:hypothetical protein
MRIRPEFSTHVSGQESIMGTRSWIAWGVIALAVVVLFFALQATHSDPEGAPGQNGNAAKSTIPSNPDTVTPRHPDQPRPTVQ